MPRIKPIKQSRARASDVEESCRGRSKADDNGHGQDNRDKSVYSRFLLNDPSSLVNLFRFIWKEFWEEYGRKSLWLPVFMACGIAAYFALDAEPPTSLLCATPACVFFLFAARKHDGALPLAATTFAFCLGFNAAQMETHWLKAPILKTPMGPVAVTGTLFRAEPQETGARLTLKYPSIASIPKEERPLFLRVKVKTPLRDLPQTGERVNVWGQLWPPAEQALPKGYDFRRHAFFHQIGGTGVSYVAPTEREARYPVRFFWDGFFLWFERARRALALMVLESADEPEEKAMTAALLSGSQQAIGKDVMQAMRASGLSHLLSISGVHVSMMGLLVYVPLRFVLALWPWIALRFPIKKWAAAAAITSTSLYTLLVGADAPTVRSALMTSLVLAAVLLDRRAMSLRLVAIAAVLIMLMEPSAAMGASFQMSFAAVLAMIAAYEKNIDFLLHEGWAPSFSAGSFFLWRYLRNIVLTSLIATAATTPFTLFHFQTFSFYGVLANILAIPLTTLWIMPSLLLVYITAPFNVAGPFIGWANEGVGVLIGIARQIAAWPYAQIAFPPPPVWAMALFLFGGFWLCLWRRRWRFIGLFPMALAFLYPLRATTPDVYIAPDTPVWGVRLSDGSLAVVGRRSENFTTAQWAQHGQASRTFYASYKKPPLFDRDLFCDESRCLYEKNGASIMFLFPSGKGGKGAPLSCPTTTLAITFEKRPPSCATTRWIDAQDLKEKGAHTIHISEDGVLHIESSRTKETQRPWTPREDVDRAWDDDQ